MKVTILITAYNYGRYIARALNSALAQSLDRDVYEVLVVDDGSTDETPAILKEFAGSIRVLQQANGGLAAACNLGIDSATGEYLIRLDADDELDPDIARLCYQVLDGDPEVGLVYTDRIEVDVKNGTRKLHRVGAGNIYDIIAPGIMFRRQRLIDVGSYDQLYWEEHDLMIRYLRQHKSHYLAEPLYVYYLHGSNMTSDSDRRWKGWEELIDKWGIDELRRWGKCQELEDVYVASAAGTISPLITLQGIPMEGSRAKRSAHPES